MSVHVGVNEPPGWKPAAAYGGALRLITGASEQRSARRQLVADDEVAQQRHRQQRRQFELDFFADHDLLRGRAARAAAVFDVRVMRFGCVSTGIMRTARDSRIARVNASAADVAVGTRIDRLIAALVGAAGERVVVRRDMRS